MHFATALVAFTAALGGVSAHPSPQAGHGHAHMHTRNHLEFRKASRPASRSDSSPTASSTSTSSGTAKAFCDGQSKEKRATYDQIMYAGNTGREGDWGCNMMVIDGADADAYDYTAKFVSTGRKYSCSCFNKVGPKGLLDGFWFSALDFTVEDGGSDDVYMAFEENTQGGCACGPGDEAPKTGLGQLAGTWLEFDWGSEPNGGNSGADASVLVAGANDMDWYGMSVSANGDVCSWVKSDGSNEDAYMPGMEAEDGVGCKGYYKGQLEVLLGDNFSH